MKKPTCLATLLVFYFLSFAQELPVNDQELAFKYSFINTVQNRIFNSTSLHPFFAKLVSLKDSSSRKVSIVHIGDSHIQADFLSGVVRNKMQTHFGNAGRGLVFPYQLAQSNAPSDIASTSNTRWQFNRLAHPEIPIKPGVSGFVLETSEQEAMFSITLREIKDVDQSFNSIRLFTAPGTQWTIKTKELNEPGINIRSSDSAITLEQPATSAFFITNIDGSKSSFYGASFENSQPGVLYHTIGVNGARYDHYNTSQIFWDQLADLDADLYIISLGTNEAQAASLNADGLKKQISIFLEKLRSVSPNASVLITTAPDSYKRGKSNLTLRHVNETISSYCDTNGIAIWNLYKASNGFGSAYSWNRRKLMSRDRIHYTADGYRLQGALLFNALAKSFNNYLSIKN